MNKSDLVDGIAAATNESKTKVAALLDAVLSSISGALQKGDRVTLPGFGTFSTRRRQEEGGQPPPTRGFWLSGGVGGRSGSRSLRGTAASGPGSPLCCAL